MLHFFCEHVLHTPVCKVKTKTQKKPQKKIQRKILQKTQLSHWKGILYHIF